MTDFCIIPLTQGKEVRVSPEDYPWVIQKPWYFNGERSPYAARTVYEDGRRKTIYLHREIVRAPPHLFVNHDDGDTLNCVRGNLVPTTHRRNSTIQKVRKGAVGYAGVWLRRTSKGDRFRVSITAKDERIYLGQFETAVEAAEAYDMAAVRLFGIHAETNFPLTRYICPGVREWGYPTLHHLPADVPF